MSRDNFSKLSSNTLYEFLRNSGPEGVHPVHRRPIQILDQRSSSRQQPQQAPRPWVPPIRRQDNNLFGISNSRGNHRDNRKGETQLTALQRLAAERTLEEVRPKPVKRAFVPPIDVESSIPIKRQQRDDENRGPAPPPMFENPTKTRGTKLSHMKGSSPQQLAKYRSMTAGSSVSSLMIPASQSVAKLLTIDDLHKSVLQVDFDDLIGSTDLRFDDQREVQVQYDSLDAYKERQSRALLVEVMEGFRQSLESGFVPQQSTLMTGMYSTVNVRVTTSVRKGREFCLLTLKRDDGDDCCGDQSSSYPLELTQGDVILLLKPQSAILDDLLKFGFTSKVSPKILATDKGKALFGIAEKNKTALVVSKGSSKSIQMKCCMASKDCPLGYSPSDCAIGSEWVAVIVHSLLTVEREWRGLCGLGTRTPPVLIETILGKSIYRGEEKTLSRRESLVHQIEEIGNLNRYQRQAIEAAADIGKRDNGVVLLQGPPGTGKTYTLSVLLRLFFKRGYKKTIVCAPSNAAIDELMGRLVFALPNRGKGGQVLRVGRNTRPDMKEYSLDSLVIESQSKVEESRHAVYKEKKQKFLNDIHRISDELNLPGTAGARKAELIRAKERIKESLDNLKSREVESVKCERDSIYKKYLGNAQFIFGTLSSFGSDSVWSNMDSIPVDYCVIDEAAQSIEVASLIPLKFSPKRLVLVGDPQQLPAVVKSAAAKRMRFDMSLIERLQVLGNKTYMLREQYRMHWEIAKFPSECFYDGKLITSETVGSWKSPLPSPLNTPVVFVNIAASTDIRSGTSIINPREGRLTADLAKFLMREEKVESVGVIAPYKQQVGLIRNLLGRQTTGTLEVDSVDAFQGREKDFIIFNCVRSGGVVDGGGVGFLADSRRLNVAITRAKRGLWIVGNAEYLLANGGPVWESLVRHCFENGFVVDCAIVEQQIQQSK